ncbi:GNAT family N-acetyltransferase [Rhodovulum sulfidophilum]|uniref:GNAT family N-acetyltransferase n=1 Tax=Rhodovulum sulfidophilum TaxID=35806 RepID=UPI0009D6F798|nr:GNAT family N-acetyltransferase [Rhodovulum sulfidophilum]MBL3554187.1 N-acetyltransferase [Rhodovulum sulfidophilum]
MADLQDADDLRALMRDVSCGDDNMLYEVDEIPQAWRLGRIISENSLHDIFVSHIDDVLVGYAGIWRKNTRRIQHVAGIYIGVSKDFRRRRVGTSLIEHLLGYAQRNGLMRLELRVSVRNLAAINLYRQVGFEFEGLARDAVVVSGRKIDKFFMAKITQ